MTNLYTSIMKAGGQILQDGSAWRDITNKDGSKIIRQIAQKNGTSAIDVFQKSDGRLVKSLRKTIEPDGRSYTTKCFNYIKQEGFIQSVLKFEKAGACMQSLFEAGNTGKIKPQGNFFSKAETQIKRGKVTFFPIGKGSINSNNPILSLYANTFNKLFGRQESSIF